VGLNPQTIEAKSAMAGGEEDIKGVTFSYFLLPILFAVLTLDFLGTIHKMYA